MYKSQGHLNKPQLGQLGEAQTAETPAKPSGPTPVGRQPSTEKKVQKRHQLHTWLIFCALLLVAFGIGTGIYLDRWEGGSIAVEELTSLTITMNINSQPQVITTNSTTVGELLSEQRIRLRSEDFIGLSMDQPLYDGMTVWLRLAVPITITADGTSQTVTSQPITVQEALALAGITVDNDDEVSLPLLQHIYTQTEIKVSRVWVERENVDEAIEPAVAVQEFTYLTPGSETVVFEGRPGVSRSTYDVTYRDGVEIGRQLISTEVATAPEDKIIGLGPAESGIVAEVDADGNPLLYTATAESGATFYYTKSLTVQSTAYTWTGNRTATGTWPVQGQTIAVDPSVIPLHSKVYVVGYGFATAEDTGGAVKGHIIDLYMDSEEDCWNWGRRNVTVYILPE